MNLVETNKEGVVITLKEITDLIDVQHSKAMKKVEKLAQEPSFGTVAKMDSVYNNKGQTVETYVLNKKQAIAVGAKLNDDLLMRVINRLEELESVKPKALVIPQNFSDALKLAYEQSLEIEQMKPVVELHNDLTHQDKDTRHFMSLGAVAKELGYAQTYTHYPYFKFLLGKVSVHKIRRNIRLYGDDLASIRALKFSCMSA